MHSKKNPWQLYKYESVFMCVVNSSHSPLLFCTLELVECMSRYSQASISETLSFMLCCVFVYLASVRTVFALSLLFSFLHLFEAYFSSFKLCLNLHNIRTMSSTFKQLAFFKRVSFSVVAQSICKFVLFCAMYIIHSQPQATNAFF